MALDGARDRVRARLIHPEADPLRLAGPCAGIDVGEALDLPVVEDRVVVGELDDDERACRDADLLGREGDIARPDLDVDRARIDGPIGGQDAARDPERGKRDDREEPRLADPPERAPPRDAVPGTRPRVELAAPARG